MPLPDYYIDRLKAEIARLGSVLEPLESGNLRIGERTAASDAWQDRTHAQIEHLKRTIGMLQFIVDRSDA